MHGHIVGLSLSPDHQTLYVNLRPWPPGYVISDPAAAPPAASQVEVWALALPSLQPKGPVLRGHKAFTDSEHCFFLNLDAQGGLVGSGAEDGAGRLWQAGYGGPALTTFPHRSVVNAVALCPSDPEVAVSVSDDHSFKVWLSRRRARALGPTWRGDQAPQPQGGQGGQTGHCGGQTQQGERPEPGAGGGNP